MVIRIHGFPPLLHWQYGVYLILSCNPVRMLRPKVKHIPPAKAKNLIILTKVA